jgi:DNA invertase Pin-like site-specific DNA recombinase
MAGDDRVSPAPDDLGDHGAAVAYYRTSSAANVDGDSEARQRAAVSAYAGMIGLTVAAEFYDAAVSGADPIDARPGFQALLIAVRERGVRKILVETANRFARDLIVQETGWRYLKGLGVELIAVDSPTSFLDDTPTAVLIRQVLGAVAQFEKAALVAKLRAARERTGRKGGRKPIAAVDPKAAARARALKGSLRTASLRLAAEGFLSPSGKPFAASTIAAMRRGKTRESA